MNTSKQIYDCLIVGAGMAGLSAAHRLRQQGRTCVLLDKGKEVGGRMASRRINVEAYPTATIDYGAQFMSARSESFQRILKDLEQEQVVRIWSHGFSRPGRPQPNTSTHPRYCGTESTRSICQYLARDLEVCKNTQIVGLRNEGGYWEARDEAGNCWYGKAIILTTPIPQALPLLETAAVPLSPIEQQTLESIDYEPRYALMAILEGPSALPRPGACHVRGDVLNWIADNRAKGISGQTTAVTLHATTAFTEAQLESPRDEVASQMIEAASPWLGSDVVHWELHRWLYSRPRKAYPAPSLLLNDQRLPIALAGDAFGESRVETAWLSGEHAANALLNLNLLEPTAVVESTEQI